MPYRLPTKVWDRAQNRTDVQGPNLLAVSREWGDIT